MAKRQSARRGKSANSSGRSVKEATGGLKKRHGMSGGKHPKNKIYTGGGQNSPKRKRHPRATT